MLRRPVRRSLVRLLFGTLPLLLALTAARAAEQVTLTNGFTLLVDHRAVLGETTRLYTAPGDQAFIDIPTLQIAAIEAAIVAAPASPPSAAAPPRPAGAATVDLPPAELHELLSTAGTEHDLDIDLLACVVQAESGGRVHAVSRTGARGLMQLMPATASSLGVNDSFRPDQNIHGGTAYLNSLLLRYHDNLALALAAYNAGPGAVDRYHGVPPFRETRAYVARIIHAYNQRKLAEEAVQRHGGSRALPATLASARLPHSNPRGEGTP